MKEFHPFTLFLNGFYSFILHRAFIIRFDTYKINYYHSLS